MFHSPEICVEMDIRGSFAVTPSRSGPRPYVGCSLPWSGSVLIEEEAAGTEDIINGLSFGKQPLSSHSVPHTVPGTWRNKTDEAPALMQFIAQWDGAENK